MGSTSHPVDLAHDHGHPRHRGLHDREEGCGPVADRRCPFRLRGNHEPRLIDKADDREVKSVAQIHEAPYLSSAVIAPANHMGSLAKMPTG